MGNRSVWIIVGAILLTLPACQEHRFAEEWESFYDGCVADGYLELSDSENFDPELIQDTCSAVVAELSGDYQDTPPSEIPNSVKDEVFEAKFEDCADLSFLEEEYC